MKNRNPQDTVLLTIDLEDWFQVENLRPLCPYRDWDGLQARIEPSAEKLLDLFDENGVGATFFVLGWIGERYPHLVREIRKRGHEIASHGYGHVMCSSLPAAALRDDLERSKKLLEDVAGCEVAGYRAPCFTITDELIEVLGDLGFRYDSSYNSFDMNRRYGRIGGSLHATDGCCLVADNGIIEIPLSNLKVGGLNLPWAGGGYFRFWPTFLFEAGVARILGDVGLYVFYCHPWEFDPGQPRMEAAGKLSRFRHYCNLDKSFDRLRHLLRTLKGRRFMSCSAYLKLIETDADLPARSLRA